jgi:hypothetical protein
MSQTTSVIDMQRLRDALPKRAVVKLRWKQNKDNRSLFIECIVRWPSLYDKGSKEEEKQLEEVLKWQREIIPAEAISEFYTEETGSHWLIYLKRVPMEFINATDEDIKSYSGYTVAELANKGTKL